jgi:hypothetical protein
MEFPASMPTSSVMLTWADQSRVPALVSETRTAFRATVGVASSVGPGNGKPADFTIASVSAGRRSDGNQELGAVVTNTGGRALDVTGDLMLTTGPGSLSAGPFRVPKVTTIAPGDARTVVFTPPGQIPNGP